MKRMLSLLLVGLIAFLIIFNPAYVGLNSNVRALTQEESVLMMYPAQFWSWWSAQSASMGMNAQNLGEQLNYLNSDGQIDDYFATVYARFQQDVQQVKVWGKVYFKTVGTFWSDLFNGGNGITGVKELWGFSQDSQSPYYIDPNVGIVTYQGIVAEMINHNTPSIWVTNTFGSGTVNNHNYNSFLMEGYDYFTLGDYEYYYDYVQEGNFTYWRKKQLSTGTISLINTSSGGYPIVDQGYRILLPWINADGSPDANGNTRKLTMIRYRITRTTDGLWTYTGTTVDTTPIISSATESYIETVYPMQFDDDVIGIDLNPADISTGSFVGTFIDDDYIDQVQELIDGVTTGTDTLVDTGVTMPKETDYTQETDNAAIGQIIGVQPIAQVVEVELDLPYVEEFELPATIINKFPFSIPWDLKRAFTMLQATASAPVFEVPFNFERYGINTSITIEFSQFSLLVKVTRFLILGLFILSLILVTRQLIKG